MKIPNKQFGSIGMLSTVCDNPRCADPMHTGSVQVGKTLRAVCILVSRDQHIRVPGPHETTRVGEFCSNTCMTDYRQHGEGENMSDEVTAPEGQKEENQMTETATATAPARKQAPAKKAAKGKAKAAKKHAASKGTQRKRGAESQASQLLALIKRAGGATMAELREVSPSSAGSLIFSLRKAGEKIVIKEGKDGSKRYVIGK